MNNGNINYQAIHTQVYPSYNYLAAENAYLRQNIEYKDAVLCEQQQTISKFQSDVSQLSQANMAFRHERDQFAADAAKWRVMKKIIVKQGSEEQLYQVEKTIDQELQLERAGQSGLTNAMQGEKQ